MLSENTIKTSIMMIVRVSIMKSITYWNTGTYLLTSILILLPNPRNTKFSIIASKNNTVYIAALNLKKI